MLHHMALVMEVFPQYSLRDILRLPLMESEFLFEQAVYIKAMREYQYHVQTLAGLHKIM